MKQDTLSNLWNDYPLDDCIKQASELIEQKNAKIHQKWTCHHCGSRQTMDEPNTFYRSGRCEECDQITVISKCNYVAVFGLFGDSPELGRR